MAKTHPRWKYFSRTVVYARRGDDVVLVDMHDASVTEAMEPWLGRVFLLADGTHTIDQLIDFVGRAYGENAPLSLGQTIDSVITRLQKSRVIALTDGPVALPYYLSLPADDQDPEKAHRLMREDGFQQAAQA